MQDKHCRDLVFIFKIRGFGKKTTPHTIMTTLTTLQIETFFKELHQVIAEQRIATTTSDNVVGGFSPLTPQQAALALQFLPSRPHSTGKVAWVVDESHDPHDLGEVGHVSLRLPVDDSPAKLVTSS